VRIAERCNFEFTFGKLHLPSLPEKNGISHGQMLTRLAFDGLAERVGRGEVVFSEKHPQKEYEERLRYELSVIDGMGFSAYYLIVRDFVAYAKSHGIPVGPGRGSGAGSLVAYCVGITDVDSVAFDLLFERFLNPERISMPDFDIDFCYERRDQVISYVRERYGDDHVAQIVTFGTLAARAAVRDVGRALGMSYADVDRVAVKIPAHGVGLADAVKLPEVKEMMDASEEIRRLLGTAQLLEGMPRHASTHAAGIVITEEEVSRYVPLSVNGSTTVTQFDMDTVAALGLVKFDFLGLRYLTIIHDAEKEIRLREPDFHAGKLPLDDPGVYRMLTAAQTLGVFQMESSGMRQVLRRLRPSGINDIIACIALYRPGPMDSIDTFIRRKHGEEPIVYEIPELREVLDVTYGCIVYQEQVMQIFRLLAGYSYARADLVRRAMSKKKADVMSAEMTDFVKGAAERGISEEKAVRLFDDMASFANYAFNKNHAAAYGMLTFRTAYLKCHYPREYMAALMTSVLDNSVKLAEYAAECAKLGIPVLPPDINESRVDFSVSGRGIRFGLLAVRGVGKQFLESLVRERSKRKFSDLADFIDRMSGKEMNRRQIEALIKCGALDSLGETRSTMLSACELLINAAQQKARSNRE
jgi:DNA polymerase-3 subunit alpha